MGDIHYLKKHPFREPKALYTLMGQVQVALGKAGFTLGSHHKGSGWSDEGCLEYEPPVPGYLVDFRDVGYSKLKEPKHYTCGVTKELKEMWEDRPLVQVFVDHAGKGRKQALPKYVEALKEAGLEAEIAPLSWHHKKQVVWVKGYFYHHGDRHEGEVILTAERLKDYGKE